MNKNRKLIFSNHIMNVFTSMETSYDELKNLMCDLAFHREMFDDEGNKIPTQVAEKKLHEINLKFFDLEPGFSRRDLNRAFEDHGK